MRLADVDVDGREDLALLTDGKLDPLHSIRLYRGRSDGTFELWSTRPGGTKTFDLALGDLDGDGVPEVATAPRQYFVAVQDGPGEIGSNEPAFVRMPTPVLQLGLADVNEDGRDDVLGLTFLDYRFAMRLSAPGGGFEEPVYLPELTQTVLPADLDGDGHVDLLLAIAGWDSRIDILFGSGDGSFKDSQSLPGPYGRVVAAADFDEDGCVDVVTSSGTGVLFFYRGLGGRTFGAPEWTLCPVYLGASQARDCDEDGDLDLFSVTHDGSLIVTLRNRTIP